MLEGGGLPLRLFGGWSLGRGKGLLAKGEDCCGETKTGGGGTGILQWKESLGKSSVSWQNLKLVLHWGGGN